MAIKKYRPTTPSRRTMVWYDFSDLTKNKTPEKGLLKFIWKSGGRNNQGRITSRFRWGGHKQLYRMVDFKGYDKKEIPATIASIEYDPYRTCRIALLNYADGEKRYVLARQGIKVGEKVLCGDSAEIKSGSRKQLKDIPDWFTVFCLEVTPMTKGKLVRSAGSYATIAGRDEATGHVIVKLQSGEVRKFDGKCWATIGKVGNEEHMNIVIGKAGRQRRKGIKPRVLGKNMNPVDHPHGGGEWHSSIGLRKGQKAFNGRRVAPGINTRSSKKWSNKFIVSPRTKN